MRAILRASRGPLFGWAAILLGLPVALLLPEGRGCEYVGEAGLVGVVDEILPMADGGFVQVGFDHVRDADWELLVIRSNADGSFRWARRCGGYERDLANTAVPREDGGMLVVGQTKSGIEWPAGAREVPFNGWLLSFDADGRLLWQRTYGGAADTTVTSGSRHRDGSYLLFGERQSPEDALQRQRWLLRVGPEGEHLWSRILGLGFRALPHPGGLEVLAGPRGPHPFGLHSSRSSPEIEWWLAQVSWAGDVDLSSTVRFMPREFDRRVRALRTDSLAATGESGHLLAGSFDYDHRVAGWIMKADLEGRILWHKVFAATPHIRGLVALPLRDRGAYLVGKVLDENRRGSFWAARLGAEGEVLWERTFVRGTPYAATLGRSEHLVIAGTTWQDGNRQTLLFVTPDGDASLVALPGEDVEIWPRYRIPSFPALRRQPKREERFIRQRFEEEVGAGRGAEVRSSAARPRPGRA